MARPALCPVLGPGRRLVPRPSTSAGRSVSIVMKATPAAGALEARLAIASDDEQARRVRLLLLGKVTAVLAHRFERPLAAELDESEQWPTRGAGTCWLLLPRMRASPSVRHSRPLGTNLDRLRHGWSDGRVRGEAGLCLDGVPLLPLANRRSLRASVAIGGPVRREGRYCVSLRERNGAPSRLGQRPMACPSRRRPARWRDVQHHQRRELRRLLVRALVLEQGAADDIISGAGIAHRRTALAGTDDFVAVADL